MKKIIFIISCFLLTVFVHGTTYEELLQKGQNYENKKEWIYALGAYADAISIADDSTIAQERYNEILSYIKMGKPGIGEFDVFSLHDEWKKLIQSSELYFTEAFPYEILYDDIKRTTVDYSTKTASYTLTLKNKETDFYKTIMKALNEGFEKTDWKNWDNFNAPWFISGGSISLEFELKPGYTSGLHNSRATKVFNEGSFSSQYTEIKKVTEYPNIHKEIVNYYKTNKVPIAAFASMLIPFSSRLQKDEDFTGIQVSTMPAFAAKFDLGNYYYEAQYMTLSYMPPVFKYGKKTCFDIQLGLYDTTGNLIAEGVKQTFSVGESSYVFTNIPQNKLTELDNQEFCIKLLGLWLNYGLYDVSLHNLDDAHDDMVRDIVKPLPNIKIATDKVRVISQKEIEEAKQAEERKRAEEAKIKNDWQNFTNEMKTKYDNYESELTTLQNSSNNKFANLGFTVVEENGDFYVHTVEKKSFAAKQKIVAGFKLISINNILIEDLVKEANTLNESYIELEDLIQEANKISHIDDIQKDGSQIIDQYRSINFNNQGLILYSQKLGKYFVSPTPSGTKLLLKGEVKGFFSTKEKEVELVIP